MGPAAGSRRVILCADAKKPLGDLSINPGAPGNYVRRCPTLPHPGECSTIGAGGLSCRVRDGTGRSPSAKTTDNTIQLLFNSFDQETSHRSGWWCAQGHTVDASLTLFAPSLWPGES